MKVFKFGTTEIVNNDSLKDVMSVASNSVDLFIMDPPFDIGCDDLLPWIDQVERTLKIGGNLVSVNYPITNMDIYYNIKKNHLDLNIKDTIIAQQGSAYKTIRGLPRRILSINVYHKGPIVERKFYAKSDMRGVVLYAPEHNNILTDFMAYKQHYPCRKGKNGETVHVGAMSKWLVKNILHCFAREGDFVYDAFGGAGTFPAICNANKINCRSVEIDSSNFELIKSELIEEKKYRTISILDASIEAIRKTNECTSRTTNKLDRSLSGCISNSKQKHQEQSTF